MRSQLPGLDSDEALEVLSHIETIYTDLDGTLLAPGGKLLCDYDGRPSFAVAEALVRLRNAGMRIVVVTGRSRLQGNEFIRILDVDEFIGEMGTTIEQRNSYGIGISYDTGSFEWDRERYTTPHEAIAASGAIEALLERYAGALEYNHPRCLNRDVTHAMRGNVDVEDVRRFLMEGGWELSLEDNGMLFRVRNTTLKDLGEIHGYHVVPANTSKAIAIRKDMEREGIDPSTAVAIGDSTGDIEMGHSAGALVVMANCIEGPNNIEKIAEISSPTFKTRRRCCDGWVEFAQTLMRAKGI